MNGASGTVSPGETGAGGPCPGVGRSRGADERSNRTVNVRHPKEFTLFSKEDIFVSLSKVCLKNYTFSEFLDSSVSG